MRSRPESFLALEALESRTLLSTITWDGGGGDNSWHNPLNWAGDVLPGPSDDVVLDQPGGLTITHDQGVTTFVRSIRSFETLSVSAGTLMTAVSLNSLGPLNLSGGIIAGAGHLDIGAAFDWTGGLISGSGTVRIGPAGKLRVDGTVTLARQIVNNGTITWASGNWRFIDGRITNLAGRTINLQSPGTIVSVNGTNLIFNAGGTIARNGTSATASTVGVRLESVGLVEARAGTLTLSGGGSAAAGNVRARAGTTVVLKDAGYIIASNTTIDGGGILTLSGGVHKVLGTFGGLGRLNLAAGGLTYFGAGSVTDFTFGSGVMSRTGNLTVTGDMTWLAGTMLGSGVLTIAQGGSLTSTGSTKGFTGTLDNRGTVVWSSRLKFTDAVIINKSEWTTGTDLYYSGGGVNRFINTGLFTKTGGLTLIFDNAAGGVSLTNQTAATVDVISGGLRLHGGGVNLGTLTGQGQGSLVFDWVSFTLGGGTLSGFPSVTVLSVVRWTGGTVEGDGLLIVAGSGSLILQGNGAKTLKRSVANSGVIAWTGGNWVWNFVSVTNSSQGELNLSSTGALTTTGGASTLTNGGVLNKTGAHTLNLAAQALTLTVSGTVDVQAGTLILGASRVSNFGAGVFSGGVWEVRDGATLTVQDADVQTASADFRIHGDGRITNFSTLRANAGVLSLLDGAVLSLTPSVNQNFVNSGLIKVDAASHLAVTGNIVLGTASRLEISVASPGEFGRLTATLNVNLAGDVRGIYLSPPVAGQTFQFITGAFRVGEFGSGSASGLPGSLKQTVTIRPNGARFAIQPA
ncbi:MAG: hypothetical protein IT437_03605 [Phycisphaerales bacterium]|nr:hypothetical protein [Phycisphaerales bacterium]